VRVKETLAKEYENSYANVGSEVVLNTVAAVGIALVLGLIVVAPLFHWLNS
jgi:preprotein translocase subunit SecF